MEKLYRDAKIGRIYEGTSNMQKMTIAKQILGAEGSCDENSRESGGQARGFDPPGKSSAG